MLRIKSRKILATFLAAGILYSVTSDAFADNVIPQISDALNMPSQSKIQKEVEEYFGEETESEKNNKDLQKLLYIIINNDNLSLKEKNIAYTLKDIISENEFLNTNMARNALSKLDVEYDCEANEYMGDNVLASYNNVTHIINVYGSETETKDDTLTHELIHCVYTRQPFETTPTYFVEGMTELLNNEYLSDNPYIEVHSYSFEITAVKIFCELIGSNRVLEAYSQGDFSIISDSLEEIGGTERTEKFLNNINDIFKSRSANKKIDEEKFNQVITYLDSYFTYLKDNEKGQEQYNNYLYYRGIIKCMSSENSIDDYLLYLSENGALYKPYFAKKLMESDITISKTYKKTKSLIPYINTENS